MQLLITLADDEFDKDDYKKDKAKILFVSFVFKKSARADFLTFNAKKTFNLLLHTFT